MTPAVADSLLQRALAQGLVSAAQLEPERTVHSCQPGAAAGSGSVLERFVAAGVLTEWQVTQLWAAEFGLECVDLKKERPSTEAIASVPRDLAQRHVLVPLSRTGNMLRVAVSDPLDTNGVDSVAHLTGLRIEPAVASRGEIEQAIAHSYDNRPELARAAAEAKAREVPGAEDAPIIALVHRVIRDAVEARASDIHWEPFEGRFRVRCRIDGVLRESAELPRNQQAAIISRIKIMANISIAQKRLPQDGRIQLALPGRTLDLRVSTLPAVHGESVVMRVLERANARVGLDQLGFDSIQRGTVERLVAAPDGMVIVTGPTGSGKTTTLYGCLHHLNQSARKIITVEDPVEYQVNGVNQVPVRSEIGMTFAAALRAMLRQAPNVIMVGEIRDRETAETAVNASLTGHLVLSTLHTNDATGAVARLADMRVKPFLLAASVRGVIAQRLVRRVCVRCSRPHRPTAAELASLGLEGAGDTAADFRMGAGCPACQGTGFRGRLGIFEIFMINPELRQMIHDRAGAARLRARARELGLRTLREDGAGKVIAGLTTAAEVVSITAGDASHSNHPHPP